MYKVLLGDELVHYAPAGIELIDPVLELEDNKSGSFKFSIAPGQPGYDLPQKLVTTVEVWCDGEALFYGRVFDESMALDRMKTVTCEGELAYLIDSIQRPASYEHVTLTQVLQSVLAEHNSQVEPFKQFELGNVTVPTPDGMITIRTDWEDTLKFIQETLLGLTGGHLVIRHADGKRYLDYLESYNRRNTQGIEFGRNLIDYSQTASAENIATCVIPLGAKLEKAEDAPEDEPDRYLTIESVNGGKDYVYNEEAVATYGWVSTAVKFDDETDPERLKEKGEEYLSSTQYDSLSLTLTAFDLGHLNADIQKIRVGDEIRVYSKPHGMDRYFPVTKQTVNLNNPEKDQIELGTTVSQNLTDRIAEGNKEIIHRIESLPSQSSTVKLAEEAAQRFAAMAAATVGYYTSTETLPDGSIITYSHDKPERSQSTNIWKRNGLVVAVSNNGMNGPWHGLDKDGNAILENIAAKTIVANKIKTGKIEGADNPYIYFDLDKGEISASRLSAARYPNFIMDVGPSENSENYGAVNVYDKTLGKNGNIFSVYRVAVGSEDRTGAVWTAPYFTNNTATDRKGIAMSAQDIMLFADKNGSARGIRVNTDGSLELLADQIRIPGTATGTLFSDNPSGGIKIENGLIKEWNLTFLSTNLDVKDSLGHKILTLEIKDGLITGATTYY